MWTVTYLFITKGCLKTCSEGWQTVVLELSVVWSWENIITWTTLNGNCGWGDRNTFCWWPNKAGCNMTLDEAAAPLTRLLFYNTINPYSVNVVCLQSVIKSDCKFCVMWRWRGLFWFQSRLIVANVATRVR